MAKLQSSFRNMFLSLSLICLTVALLLAQVNKMTATPIAEAKAMKLQSAIREVVPAFDNDPVAEAYRMADGSGDSLLVYPAKQGGELVGFALNSYSNNGFSGNIQIMVGFDMFLLFDRLSFRSRIINRIARSAFAVYLITDYPATRALLWKHLFVLENLYQQPFAILQILGILLTIYLVSAL